MMGRDQWFVSSAAHVVEFVRLETGATGSEDNGAKDDASKANARGVRQTTANISITRESLILTASTEYGRYPTRTARGTDGTTN